MNLNVMPRERDQGKYKLISILKAIEITLTQVKTGGAND